MTRLETLIELEFLNSSFSSLSSYLTVPFSSNSRQQYLSQEYPPPLSIAGTVYYVILLIIRYYYSFVKLLRFVTIVMCLFLFMYFAI